MTSNDVIKSTISGFTFFSESQKMPDIDTETMLTDVNMCLLYNSCLTKTNTNYVIKMSKVGQTWISKCGCYGNAKNQGQPVDTSKFRLGTNE